MCISTVLLTLAARERKAQEVANNYRNRLVVCLVSIAVVGETTALQQTRRLVAVWLSASRVHKMLGAKLGFRVLITSADLLPSPVRHARRPTSRYNASSVFSAATLPGRLTGMLQRELGFPTTA